MITFILGALAAISVGVIVWLVLNINKMIEQVKHLEEQKQKLFLIDIDGTICDDIRNEDSELYPTANVFPRALEIINKWYDEGNVITFFTARESKDREVTLQWLDKHGFKYHGLVMDKPRINDEQEYVWIDNKKVRAVTYLGNWTELKEVDAKIQIFG
jgi:trehalose-6-phosphatase